MLVSIKLLSDQAEGMWENPLLTLAKYFKMPLTVYLSGQLKTFTGGATELGLKRDHLYIGDALDELWSQHPGLRDRVLDEQGEIRTHVNIFIGGKSVKQLHGLATPIDAEELHIFNAVSGG